MDVDNEDTPMFGKLPLVANDSSHLLRDLYWLTEAKLFALINTN